MPNPIKIAKLVSKQVKKRDAARTAVRKKSYSAAPAKAKFLTPTTGKRKVDRKVGILDTIAEHRTGGNLGYVYKKGKMIEVFDNHPPIKVKPRNIGKLTKQMAPNKKQTEKIIRKVTPKKPGIPVKRRSK